MGENVLVRPWTSAAAARRPHHPFLELPDRVVPYGEFEVMARSAIGSLRDGGVEPGDRVGVWAQNRLESVVALAAVPGCGAASVLLDPRLASDEIRGQVERARVSLVVGPEVMPDLGVPRLSPASLDGRPQSEIEPDPHALHSIVFTSGSAGKPKGVRLTWGNLEASAAASASHLRHREDDRWLLALPVCHVGGLMVLVRSARQASTVVLEPRFEAGRVAELLREGKATLASLVAVMLERLLAADPGPYRGVRAVLVGGGGAPIELLREAADAGLPVLPSYGMTETSSQIATARLEDGLHPRPRVFALPGAEITIDPEGRILVRGPMVSPGYVGEPDRPRDGWLDTGDLGEFDVEGALRVLGRADDVVITGGEKVHPHEVEQALREHPDVADVCVVGVPDRAWGQRVVAVYEGSATPGDLERLARYRLAGFKIPRTWLRVDPLPRLPVGKVDREAVRRMAGGG